MGTMAKLLVYLDEDFHEDLKELAHRKKTSMAALVRYALDKTFEDDLDEISSRRALEEMLAHPEDTMTLDEYLERRGIALSDTNLAEGEPRPPKVAEERARYGQSQNSGARTGAKAKTDDQASRRA
jgi:predicted DNA-binding ribbon-helix-helix protein